MADNSRSYVATTCDVGHYFDQAVLDRRYLMLSYRAAQMAMELELQILGVSVDALTGTVTIKPPATVK